MSRKIELKDLPDAISAKIRVDKMRSRWYIQIGKHLFSSRHLSKVMGISYKTLNDSIKDSYKISKKSAVDAVRVRLWKKQNGVPDRVKVYRRGKKWLVLDDVLSATGSGKDAAYKALQAWEAGEITEEELFTPVKKNKKPRTAINIHRDPRTQKIRRENLRRIPGPTEIEKRLWGIA